MPAFAVEAAPAAPAYAEAVALRTSGRPQEAATAFEALARERPADADVWLNLGLSYLALQRYQDADRALERTLALAPAYGDARLAYARSALFSGRPELARERLGDLAGQEATTLRGQIESARADVQTRWRLDLAYARSELSNGLGHWTSAGVAVGRRGERVSLNLLAEHTTRFNVHDLYVEGLAARRVGRDGEAYIAVGGGPDADYRPEIAFRGGVSAPVARAGAWSTRLGADASWARYRSGEVKSLQPYLTLAWEERAALTVRSVNTLDENDDYRAGYAVRLEARPAPRLRLHAGWADAPESSDGRTVTVRAASAGLALDLNAATAVSLTGAHEMRDAYDRDELALGLTRRF
jgi:YaiO family outer membrane protein